MHRHMLLLQQKVTLWTTTLYIFFSFYVFGCLVLENDLNYPTWQFIGAAHFPMYHQDLNERLIYILFLPMGIQLMLNVLFIFFHPTKLRKNIIMAALSFHLYVLVESLVMQVPIHAQLQQQFTLESLQLLIQSHRRYRLPGEIAALALDIVILYHLIKSLVVQMEKSEAPVVALRNS